MATHIPRQEAEPLFKAKTIRQKKIAEWLSANGVTREVKHLMFPAAFGSSRNKYIF